mgnify:CR=1 FL=1
MKGLLVQSVRRVTGKDGEPVIQLKTAFGGGKTHSMLALYHLLRGKAPLEKIPTVRPVLAEAGVGHLPAVHVAVLVGTALDPQSQSKAAESSRCYYQYPVGRNGRATRSFSRESQTLRYR